MLTVAKVPPTGVANITFSVSKLADVAAHEDELIVLSVVLARHNVYRVLIDQGSPVDVMFWDTFVGWQIPKEQLQRYDEVLVGFLGENIDVRGYVEFRATFTDGTLAQTIMIKYMVVNVSSSYNLLLGRPSLPVGSGVINIVYEDKVSHNRQEGRHHEGR